MENLNVEQVFDQVSHDAFRDDESIKQSVYNVLNDHPDLEAADIEVQVEEGIVYLRGTVEDRSIKKEAETLIDGLDGVVEIINELDYESYH